MLSYPSIAVIKYYSEHLWNPMTTKKKLKPEGSAPICMHTFTPYLLYTSNTLLLPFESLTTSNSTNKQHGFTITNVHY